MEMLPRGNLRMGAALCLLLLALLHEATGQRRRPGRRNYNRVENSKENGNSSGKANNTLAVEVDRWKCEKPMAAAQFPPRTELVVPKPKNNNESVNCPFCKVALSKNFM